MNIAADQTTGATTGSGQAAEPEEETRTQAKGSGLSMNSAPAQMFRRDRNISVSQRPRDGYQALGIHSGAFFIYPKVTAGVDYNDNIYATQTGELNDVIWKVTPEVNVASDWSRHSLGAYARGVYTRYQDFSGENTSQYGAGVSGRIDVQRDTRISGNVDWSRSIEPRSSPNSPTGALEPVHYDLGGVRISAQQEFNRLRLTGRYSADQYRYKSPPRNGGGVVDQTFRDRTVQTAAARADYAVSPDTAVFLEVSGNKRDYRVAAIPPALNRDSQGVQALSGVNFELGATARGELAVGVTRQSFDAPTLADIKGLGARAEVEWFPTQLTTVTFTAARTVEDSAVPGSGAFLSTNVGAKVEHELLRNLIITADAGYGIDKYNAIGRKDARTNLGIKGTALLNRNLGLTAGYAYSKTESKRGVGNPFDQNRVYATLSLQY